MKSIALIALAALIATPAVANKGRSSTSAAPEAAPAAGQGAPAAKPERKTCRTFANTVSRAKSERLCYTREQWEKFDQTQQ